MGARSRYPATEDGWQHALDVGAARADLLVKASGVGVLDKELEIAVPQAAKPGTVVAYWDVDAPATLMGSPQARAIISGA